MATGAQVIKFVLVDFDKNWKRVNGAGMIVYESVAPNAHVAVVRESGAGVAVTYRYTVPANEAVWVINDVIHLPERCIKREPGDTVQCSG